MPLQPPRGPPTCPTSWHVPKSSLISSVDTGPSWGCAGPECSPSPAHTYQKKKTSSHATNNSPHRPTSNPLCQPAHFCPPTQGGETSYIPAKGCLPPCLHAGKKRATCQPKAPIPPCLHAGKKRATCQPKAPSPPCLHAGKKRATCQPRAQTSGNQI